MSNEPTTRCRPAPSEYLPLSNISGNFAFPAAVNIIGLSLILLLSLILFYPTFFAGFLFDDWGDLANSYSSSGVLLWNLMPTNGEWRSVTYLVWRSSYALFGVDPLGYHLLHFVLHLLITLMVWRLVRLLSNNDLTALCAAFLFAINQVTITPVAWISASIDQNLLLFGLPAVLLYINTARTIRVSKEYPFVRILVFTLLAWLTFKSKLMAITMPAIYLLLDVVYCSNQKNFKARVIDSIKHWLQIVWPLLVLTLVWIPNYLDLHKGIGNTGAYSTSFGPLNYFASWGTYISRVLGLNGYYSASAAWIGGAVGAGALIYGVIFRQRNILFGMLWFSITIFPVAILTTHHFDHHLYLPIVGLVLAGSVLLSDLFVRFKIASRRPVLVVILGVLACSYVYVMYPFYKDWTVQTKDSRTYSQRTLDQIYKIVPTIPEQVTFLVYPRPRWSLLNYTGALNFMYNQFHGISVVVFDDQSKFDAAIKVPPKNTTWYALRYQPSDGSVKLVNASANFPINR